MCQVVVVCVAVLLLLMLGCGVRAWDCQRACSCQTEHCVPAGARVFVACPSPPTTVDAEVSFRLHRGEGVHATYDFNGSKHKPAALRAGLQLAAWGADGRVELHINYTLGGKWARFAIAGVTAGDGGLYHCVARVLHPGAVLTFCNASTVDLMLQGTQCQAPPLPPPWFWIGAVAVLVLYAALMTVVASVKVVKIIKADVSENVYMNSKRWTTNTSERLSAPPRP